LQTAKNAKTAVIRSKKFNLNSGDSAVVAHQDVDSGVSVHVPDGQGGVFRSGDQDFGIEVDGSDHVIIVLQKQTKKSATSSSIFSRFSNTPHPPAFYFKQLNNIIAIKVLSPKAPHPCGNSYPRSSVLEAGTMTTVAP
jgi:hypothetical protein